MKLKDITLREIPDIAIQLQHDLTDMWMLKSLNSQMQKIEWLPGRDGGGRFEEDIGQRVQHFS